MKTSDDICGQTGVTNDIFIHSSVVINETVYLFFGKYFNESVIDMKRHVIEVNPKPTEFAIDWKYNSKEKLIKDKPMIRLRIF